MLVYLLLMEGFHPFMGKYTGSGDPPSIPEAISRFLFVGSRGFCGIVTDCEALPGGRIIASMPNFLYDVAFSFLAVDEPLARQINKLVSIRVKTFVYSERQLEIAGSDGVETFSNVFGRDARTVVVLCRAAWGTTTWTRIEETAIRDRLLNEGPDFVTFVLLKKDAKPPKWFPASRLWTDFDLLGISGVATVALERVAHAGRIVREPTPAEYAARLEESRRAEGERLRYLRSPDAVNAANQSVDDLFTTLERLSPDAGIALERCHPQLITLYRDHFTVAVGWHVPFTNTVEESVLSVTEWEGRPSLGTTRYAGQAEEIRTYEFRFDLIAPGDVGWRGAKGSAVFSSRRLAEHCAMLLLRRIESASANRRPRGHALLWRPDGWSDA